MNDPLIVAKLTTNEKVQTLNKKSKMFNMILEVFLIVYLFLTKEIASFFLSNHPVVRNSSLENKRFESHLYMLQHPCQLNHVTSNM